MPINYQIDSSLGVVFTTFEGVVTREDALALVERLRTDPAFQPSFNQLVDTRGATRYDLSANDIQMVYSDSAFGEKSRRAMVADEDYIFGMHRMYQLLREAHEKPGQIQVFRDMTEARRWLGLDEATKSN